MSKTKIHWADSVINPVVGCSKISEGCTNCYAENMARRLAAMGMEQYQSVVKFGAINDWKTGYKGWNGKTDIVYSELNKPYKWKKPRAIFISSMGDLFHNTANIKWQFDVLDMVYRCTQHTFIVLTKRPENMKVVIEAYAKENGILPNLILGVSVEDQATADERIPILLQIPAAKRFISLEPMIGPVAFLKVAIVECPTCNDGKRWTSTRLSGRCYKCGSEQRNSGIDSVILGGESGPRARFLDPAWVRTIRDQCKVSNVSFFFKQWGNIKSTVEKHSHDYENVKIINSGKKFCNGFPLLDDRTHTELAWNLRKRGQQ